MLIKNKHYHLKQKTKIEGSDSAQQDRLSKKSSQQNIDRKTRHAINDYVNNYHLLNKNQQGVKLL
jgi:hypothetical protein